MSARAILFMVILGLGSAASGQDVDHDLFRMQGYWEVASLEIEGIKLVPEGFQVHIRGNRLTYCFFVSGKPMTAEFVFKLRPTAMPKTMDAVRVSPSKPKLPYCEHLGIYSIEGNTLRLCLEDQPRATRPTAFQAKPGSNLQCLELQRIAPDAQGP